MRRFTILTLVSLAAAAAPTAPAAENGSSPAGAAYRVPYRLTETNHLLVRAKLNGQGPFNFIIDTGAPALYLATGTAQKAGVPRGSNGWSTVGRMEIEGGPVVEKAAARVEDLHQLQGMNSMRLAGSRLDGVFGYTVLARFRMTIDLSEPAMVWTRLEKEPQLPASVFELSGEKPAAPPPGIAAMEGLSRMMSTLLARPGEEKVVGRGFLGVELADGPAGVTVRAVLPESPAARAGLKAGQRITHAGVRDTPLQPVRASADLVRLAAIVAPGDPVRFKLLSGGKPAQVTIKAGGGL